MVSYDSITVRSDGNPFRSHRTNLFLLIMDLLPTYFFRALLETSEIIDEAYWKER
jgi:hypothetical protein